MTVAPAASSAPTPVAKAKPAAKPRPKPAPKPAAKPAEPTTTDEPVQHISQEEAVAHIQALLEAKRERDRQPPSWPTGENGNGVPASQPGNESTPPSPTAASPEANYANEAHQRGDQQKNKG
ncbi:hypothetical protein Y886_35940 [Xanthomonas hyacinthi DSM 19077]|nr:hypothetical protein Y886_35940 [Xanthomonas hyacinthi DSM 19077]